MIDSFRGQYDFLSNFYPCEVTYDGVQYPSVEHAYQAAKFPPEMRKPFLTGSPGNAKRLGKGPGCRSDWEQVKLDIMQDLVEQKFEDTLLRRWLIDTGDEELVESNTWGDRFWGVYRGTGKNHLGRILMGVRS